jgi:hypothetical protein
MGSGALGLVWTTAKTIIVLSMNTVSPPFSHNSLRNPCNKTLTIPLQNFVKPSNHLLKRIFFNKGRDLNKICMNIMKKYMQ